MTKEERQKLYAALAAPFPEEAIERTDGKVTGKGYSTSGIKAQFVIDRLAEVLGVGGYRTERTITVKEITTAKGRAAYEAICELRLQLGEWSNGVFIPFAETLGEGGHVSISESDARKGAFSNAMKRAVAACGPGREAYRGTLDDDNTPGFDGARVAPVSLAPRPLAMPIQSSPQVPPRASASPALPERSRLTAKQHAMIRSLAREHGYADTELQEEARRRFSVAVDFLTRAQASELITTLSSNGHDRQPNQEV